MDKAYGVKQHMNPGKQAKVLQTLLLYRATGCKIASCQWRFFYEQRAGRFNKNLGIKTVQSDLSERFKQTCQYQVVGTLNSFLSNRQNDFVEVALRSSLDKDTKTKLLNINFCGRWHADAPYSIVRDKLEVTAADIKLSRKIFKHVMSKHRKPSFNRMNMSLDSKVAVITPKKQDKATAFDYWIRLSTYEKGNPLMVPVESNGYFEGITGKRKNFCQFNFNKHGDISLYFIKDIPDRKDSYVPLTDKICLDIGLATAMATDRGDLFGRDFIDRLLYYDNRITPLAANRQRQGLPVRSPRYDRRVQELRQYLKNEINRLLNRIKSLYCPAEILVEKLDFRDTRLSKRMNRLLSRYGKTYIVAKLKALQEEFGIATRYEHPAYTSQECSVCGYVDKNNRKTQAKFQCNFCHRVLHADVNSTRNLKKRSSLLTPLPLSLSRSDVLRILTKRFVDSLSDTERRFHLRHSNAVSLLSANPYFAGTLAQLKG